MLHKISPLSIQALPFPCFNIIVAIVKLTLQVNTCMQKIEIFSDSSVDRVENKLKINLAFLILSFIRMSVFFINT